MKIQADNIVNINNRHLVVKRTNKGYLYYNNYRQTGSKETYYATLFTLEQAQAKVAWLQTRTKGKFDIISAKEVFCNSWRFEIRSAYGSTEQYISVRNEAVAVERVRLKQVTPRDYLSAMVQFKDDCARSVAGMEDSIKRYHEQIKHINTCIKQIEEKQTTFSGQITSNVMEETLKNIVDSHAVPADTTVSILFGKGS